MLSRTCRALLRLQPTSSHAVRSLTHSANLRGSSRPSVILGIETSCDDTGCALVSSDGVILGEGLHSQMKIHLDHGGIVPPVARNLHNEHIQRVLDDALRQANMKVSDVDAIATTVKPGLPLSLAVGKDFGKQLAAEFQKPFIPIHHMQAHALMVRMCERVDFPFLVLLVSGGHCLLAVVQGVDQFLLLGQSIDDAPGEALDKVARRLSLRHIPELANVCGGRAVEILASRGDPMAFIFNAPLCKYRDCNFTVSGLKNAVRRHIMRQEKIFNVPEGEVLPNVGDICASFQLAIARHLCHRVQRAMEFIELKNLIPGDVKSLVVSGGVACNSFIRRTLQKVCEEYDYTLHAPPPKLCTDNGVMIAWNGVEKWRAGIGVAEDLSAVDIEAKAPLGVDLRDEVEAAQIRCRWVKLKTLSQCNENTKVSASQSL